MFHKKLAIVMVFLIVMSTFSFAADENSDNCVGFWGSVKCFLWGDASNRAGMGWFDRSEALVGKAEDNNLVNIKGIPYYSKSTSEGIYYIEAQDNGKTGSSNDPLILYDSQGKPVWKCTPTCDPYPGGSKSIPPPASAESATPAAQPAPDSVTTGGTPPTTPASIPVLYDSDKMAELGITIEIDPITGQKTGRIILPEKYDSAYATLNYADENTNYVTIKVDEYNQLVIEVINKDKTKGTIKYNTQTGKKVSSEGDVTYVPTAQPAPATTGLTLFSKELGATIDFGKEQYGQVINLDEDTKITSQTIKDGKEVITTNKGDRIERDLTTGVVTFFDEKSQQTGILEPISTTVPSAPVAAVPVAEQPSAPADAPEAAKAPETKVESKITLAIDLSSEEFVGKNVVVKNVDGTVYIEEIIPQQPIKVYALNPDNGQMTPVTNQNDYSKITSSNSVVGTFYSGIFKPDQDSQSTPQLQQLSNMMISHKLSSMSGSYSDNPDNQKFVDDLHTRGYLTDEEYAEINGGSWYDFNTEEDMAYVQDLINIKMVEAANAEKKAKAVKKEEPAPAPIPEPVQPTEVAQPAVSSSFQNVKDVTSKSQVNPDFETGKLVVIQKTAEGQYFYTINPTTGELTKLDSLNNPEDSAIITRVLANEDVSAGYIENGQYIATGEEVFQNEQNGNGIITNIQQLRETTTPIVVPSEPSPAIAPPVVGEIPAKPLEYTSSLYLSASGGNFKALTDLETLASQNNPLANLALAGMYEKGEGVLKDLSKAKEYYAEVVKYGTDDQKKLASFFINDIDKKPTQQELAPVPVAEQPSAKTSFPDEKTQSAQATASVLKEATDGWGTDEDAIYQALESKTPEEIALIKSEFKKETGQDLDEIMKDELTKIEFAKYQELTFPKPSEPSAPPVPVSAPAPEEKPQETAIAEVDSVPSDALKNPIATGVSGTGVEKAGAKSANVYYSKDGFVYVEYTMKDGSKKILKVSESDFADINPKTLSSKPPAVVPVAEQPSVLASTTKETAKDWSGDKTFEGLPGDSQIEIKNGKLELDCGTICKDKPLRVNEETGNIEGWADGQWNVINSEYLNQIPDVKAKKDLLEKQEEVSAELAKNLEPIEQVVPAAASAPAPEEKPPVSTPATTGLTLLSKELGATIDFGKEQYGQVINLDEDTKITSQTIKDGKEVITTNKGDRIERDLTTGVVTFFDEKSQQTGILEPISTTVPSAPVVVEPAPAPAAAVQPTSFTLTDPGTGQEVEFVPQADGTYVGTARNVETDTILGTQDVTTTIKMVNDEPVITNIEAGGISACSSKESCETFMQEQIEKGTMGMTQAKADKFKQEFKEKVKATKVAAKKDGTVEPAAAAPAPAPPVDIQSVVAQKQQLMTFQYEKKTFTYNEEDNTFTDDKGKVYFKDEEGNWVTAGKAKTKVGEKMGYEPEDEAEPELQAALDSQEQQIQDKNKQILLYKSQTKADYLQKEQDLEKGLACFSQNKISCNGKKSITHYQAAEQMKALSEESKTEFLKNAEVGTTIQIGSKTYIKNQEGDWADQNGNTVSTLDYNAENIKCTEGDEYCKASKSNIQDKETQSQTYENQAEWMEVMGSTAYLSLAKGEWAGGQVVGGLTSLAGRLGSYQALSNALVPDATQNWMDAANNEFLNSWADLPGLASKKICDYDERSRAKIPGQSSAFVQTQSGSFQFVGKILAERSDKKVPIACKINPNQEAKEKFICFGSQICKDNSFCYESEEDTEPIMGYFYKIDWGVSAPADEKFTPYVDEDGKAVKFNIRLDNTWAYKRSGAGMTEVFALENGASDRQLMVKYLTGEYGEACIEFDSDYQVTDYYGDSVEEICADFITTSKGTVDYTSTSSGHSVTSNSGEVEENI